MDEESASCSKDQPFGRKKTRDISEEAALVKQSQKKCQESNGKKMESRVFVNSKFLMIRYLSLFDC